MTHARTHFRIIARTIVLVCMVCVSASHVTAQSITSIQLRTSVRATEGTLTIGHVARVSGIMADTIEAIELNNGRSKIELKDIRDAIQAELSDVNWGSVILSGSICTIVRISEEQPHQRAAASHASREDHTIWKIATDVIAISCSDGSLWRSA